MPRLRSAVDIRRQGVMAEKEKMTLILFSGEMDKALAAFSIATYIARARQSKISLFI